ncbi:MAG TPA: POTRA domain-containing protein, partial [Bacteroidales bacterium]|nr:POTRA domain-containing protein [Bacteroidales bacterium]
MSFNSHSNRPAIQGILVVIILVSFSCSPAKRLTEGQYLLGRNHIEASEKPLSESELKSYILQRPNKRLFGARFYLFLYNLANPEKQKWPHGWLRKIGEEPVIYDSTLTKGSTQQLSQFLENKGFYKAEVSDSVYYKKKDAIVTYGIDFNEPYRVKSIRRTFEDTSLASKVLADSSASLLKLNMRFDKDRLQEERTRIETLLKEQGYFNFSKEYIFYDALTDPDDNSVELTMHIKEYSESTPDPFSKVRVHPIYRIRNIFVYPNFTDADYSPDTKPDTVFFRNIYFLSNSKPNFKPNAIASRNYLIPGELYRLSNVNRTYRNVSSLNIVRFTNISFREIDSIPAFGHEKYLDARIEITQKKLQSFQAEIAGTNSSGDLGVRGNLLYSNFNLFRGAEVFNMRITGAIESLKNQTDGKYKSMKEIGAESSIIFPKFFVPIPLEGFVKKFAPKTSILVSFNYQSRPDFTRSIANSSFSYRWSGNNYLTHSVVPLEFSYVNIYES